MNVGLFGGSFDPIHWGHIRPVQEARLSLGLDRVLYLPTAQPPHKRSRRFAPAYARFCMVELALLREEGLFASSCELTQARPAYTVETVEHFQATRPAWSLHLIMGGDSFAELSTWRRWEDLVRLVKVVVLARPGRDPSALLDQAPPQQVEAVRGGRIIFVENRPWDLSSSRIRETLAQGGTPAADTCPEPVLHYILKYDLYR